MGMHDGVTGLLGAFFLAFGLLFVCIGLGIRWASARAAERRIGEALATVVDVVAVRSRDSDGHASVTYAPVVEFVDMGGTRHVAQSSVSSRPAEYAVGEAVTVTYQPDDPEGNFSLPRDGFTMGLVVGIFVGIGALFAAIGAALAVASRLWG